MQTMINNLTTHFLLLLVDLAGVSLGVWTWREARRSSHGLYTGRRAC